MDVAIATSVILLGRGIGVSSTNYGRGLRFSVKTERLRLTSILNHSDSTITAFVCDFDIKTWKFSLTLKVFRYHNKSDRAP